MYIQKTYYSVRAEEYETCWIGSNQYFLTYYVSMINTALHQIKYKYIQKESIRSKVLSGFLKACHAEKGLLMFYKSVFHRLKIRALLISGTIQLNVEMDPRSTNASFQRHWINIPSIWRGHWMGHVNTQKLHFSSTSANVLQLNLPDFVFKSLKGLRILALYITVGHGD